MDVIFDAFKEFEKQGGTVEVGCIEKGRKKEMSEAMKKLKEIGDENKINLAKTLARYYGILSNMGYISTSPNIPFKEDKYGLHYIHKYLENFVDSAKRSIAGVMTALANDEKIRPFYKNLMFTHLYTPEELVKIERKELIRERKKIEKEIECEELNKIIATIKFEELNTEISEEINRKIAEIKKEIDSEEFNLEKIKKRENSSF